MKTPKAVPMVKNAVFTLAEIKAATEAFDRGEANIIDALDAIIVVVDAYRTLGQSQQEAA